MRGTNVEERERERGHCWRVRGANIEERERPLLESERPLLESERG